MKMDGSDKESSACYPVHPESLSDISAVCYNSSLSLKCSLHCDLVGLLENGPTAVFLSACLCSRNHLSYRMFKTLPKYFSFFFFFSFPWCRGFRVPVKVL